MTNTELPILKDMENEFLRLTRTIMGSVAEEERRYDLQNHLRYLLHFDIDPETTLDFYLRFLREKELLEAIETVKDIAAKCGISVDELRSLLDLIQKSGYSIEDIDSESVKGVVITHSEKD